ncbi:MAG: 1-deoxy-D-xylulose-5-phosphate reductoisomerase [Clostridioides sp.]|jgi:1-deoxy-D-xylulose-5-phosphate reductoisomerase|nr:1-deoxy-D-xylulose-5-phosphate reductoisomerase [Clostridioides sp.]
MKKLSILGSTGSIGTQTLDVVRNNPDKFQVIAISANKNVDLIVEQIREFKPKYVCMQDERAYKKLKELISNNREIFSIDKDIIYNEKNFSDKDKIKILCGTEGLKEIASIDEVDIVLTAVVGMVGLVPTMAAIEKGKDIALANKETLVTAGEHVMNFAKEKGVKILPVDSEHSAVFQSLQGENKSSIEKIILTASGGPFRGKKRSELEKVTKNEALKHPNWSMGHKITIDSSTLMNKGLEVIEAKWLFDVPVDKIDVVVHPQSIIHSMVQFEDSSVIAQLGCPDMRLPIEYALMYPKRTKNNLERLDLAKVATLTFEKPDFDTFPCLKLAYEVLKKGYTYPTVLNAANEVLVEKFYEDKISFYDIPYYIEKVLEVHNYIKNPSIEDILEVDKWAKEYVIDLVKKSAQKN